MAIKNNDLDITLPGKFKDDQSIVLQGVASLSNSMNLVLVGVDPAADDLDITLQGKTVDDQSIVLSSKFQDELAIILKSVEDLSLARRLTLLDELRLRDTSVYRAPRDISILKLVYGDFSFSKIPCTALDEDGTMHHITDLSMMSISKVYVDDSPVTAGFKAYTSYQDETGKPIACVIFDNPQYDKPVAVSGKGIIDEQTGELIENPAKLITHVLLKVQGYTEDSLDSGALALFYADCLREEIKVAVQLNEVMTIKGLLDELAKNIHARWLISDGKSVMKLRWI